MIRATLTDGRDVFVEFRHEQFTYERDGKRYPRYVEIADTNGLYAKGYTLCFIADSKHVGPDTAVWGEGVTFCSKYDNFDKETGRQIALQRAAMQLDKPDRGIVVAAYFNRKRGATTPSTLTTTTT